MFIEIQVLIPQADNDGHTFTAEEDEVFTHFVASECGGCSWLPDTVRGAWIGEGRLYEDRNRVVVIGIPSITDGAKIARVIAFAKSHYRQLAIAIRYLGTVEIV